MLGHYTDPSLSPEDFETNRIALDTLEATCLRDRGSLTSTFFDACDAPSYNRARVRDLAMLRETARVLPGLQDSFYVAARLRSIMSDMNTLEGEQAFYNLLQEKFMPEGRVLTQAGLELSADNEGFREEWNGRFGSPAPIAPEDFAEEADIPAYRPAP